MLLEALISEILSLRIDLFDFCFFRRLYFCVRGVLGFVFLGILGDLGLLFSEPCFRGLLSPELLNRGLCFCGPELLNRGLCFRGLLFRGLLFRGLLFRGLLFRGLLFRGLLFRGLLFRGEFPDDVSSKSSSLSPFRELLGLFLGTGASFSS